MGVTQPTYSARIAAAVAGMIANEINTDIDTRICETVAGLAFGIAVSQGSGDQGCVIGGAAAADFVGVTVRDVTLPPANSDKYARYDNVAVLTKGDIWVTVGGDVVAGNNVTFVTTTGVLGSVAADGTHLAVAGARWMSSASNGGLAVLRLSGELPSA